MLSLKNGRLFFVIFKDNKKIFVLIYKLVIKI